MRDPEAYRKNIAYISIIAKGARSTIENSFSNAIEEVEVYLASIELLDKAGRKVDRGELALNMLLHIDHAKKNYSEILEASGVLGAIRDPETLPKETQADIIAISQLKDNFDAYEKRLFDYIRQDKEMIQELVKMRNRSKK